MSIKSTYDGLGGGTLEIRSEQPMWKSGPCPNCAQLKADLATVRGERETIIKELQGIVAASSARHGEQPPEAIMVAALVQRLTQKKEE